MSDIYSTLNLSPRKKRCPPDYDNDNTLSPKKMRIAPPTPPPTITRKVAKSTDAPHMPLHLARLLEQQVALQRALSHGLASSNMTPSFDTGIILNVADHISLASNSSSSQIDVEALQKLCWLWEWDAKTLGSGAKKQPVEDDNPFLSTASSSSKDWTRGGMALVISSGSHFSKVDKKRVPAYAIGIETGSDWDEQIGGAVAAIARWTAGGETRNAQFRTKLMRWMELNTDVSPIPDIPLADLPALAAAAKPSRLFPKTPTKPRYATPTLSSASKSSATSLLRSPAKRTLTSPATPTSRTPSPTKNSILFPTTPSSRFREASVLLTPTSSRPQTPETPHRGSSTPQTPSTARRQALYDRIRQKSITASPSKSSGTTSGLISRDQMLKLNQEEMRRRCLLGRLGGVADGVWMLFSAPTTTAPAASPSKRKRRALPLSEVVNAVIKSSPVPISAAEARESLDMLTNMCSFFIRPLDITGEEWLEMPATSSTFTPETNPTGSPGRSVKDSVEEIVTRSPKRVKREGGGLREVREIIRRELEAQD